MTPHRVFSRLALILLVAAPLAAQGEAEDAYRYLAGLVERGLYARAVGEGEAFLERWPEHERASLARYRLASALFELGRSEEATPHYEDLAARRGFEYRAESSFRLGQCHLTAGRADRAQEALRTVLKLDQEYLHGPATFLLGEAAFRLGDPASAARSYAAYLERDEDTYRADARRGLVWCAWETHDVTRTVDEARAFLERHAEHASADEVRVVLGEALLEGGRPEEALEALRGASSGTHADAARRGAGFALAALERHEEAAREFAALVEEQPESPHRDEAALQTGVQLWKAGRMKQAVRALSDRALADDPSALYWLARAQTGAGDERAALATLERALSLGPDAEETQRLQIARGEVLTSLGSGDAALAAFEAAGSDYALYAGAVTGLNDGDAAEAARLARLLLEQHPGSGYRTETRLVLGESLFALERHAEAREAFEAVLAEKPEPAQRSRALLRLGWCHYLEGDPRSAARRFRELLERDAQAAEAEEARWMLGRALQDAGDVPGALEAWTRHLEQYPEAARRDQVLFALALAETGEASRRSFERLLAEHPRSPLVPESLLRLGDLQAAAGEHEAAVARYRELLKDPSGSEHAGAARYGLGWSLQELGRAKEAARELGRCAEDPTTPPDLARAARELAIWAHAGAGDPDGAVASWRAFLREADDRRAFDAARTAVQALRDAGRLAEGQGVLDELLAHVSDPGVRVAVLLEGAYLALDEGDVDRAQAQVQVAERAAQGQEELAASVAEASFFVGEARFEADDLERATELYRRAAGVAGTYADRAAYKLGFAELRREHDAEAEKAFAFLVDNHPKSELRGEALFLLGEARFRQGKDEGSVEALERLLREAPRHEVVPKALFRLGLAQARRERWGEAERVLGRLAKDFPDFANADEAELWRGKALAAQRKHTPARQALERVISRDRGELAAEARLTLGRMYEADRRFDDALSEYLKVAVLFGHEEKVAEALYRAGLCLEGLGETEQAAARFREVVEEHEESPFAEAARRRLGGGSR